MAYITCRELVPGYEGRAVAPPLTFAVEDGDYLSIVGENGAGKSTLMKTLLGLQEPLSGEIDYGDGIRRNEVGYLPQQTVVQKDFPASVWEIVLSGTLSSERFHPFYTKGQKERARKQMERMEIWDLKKDCYRDLSGGQQQRVLLARALCAAEKLLLLDEPVSGLDPRVTHDFYQLIAGLNKEGMTIIMVSHDMDAALGYSSHILHVGKQSFFGTKEDYVSSDIWKIFGNGLVGTY